VNPRTCLLILLLLVSGCTTLTAEPTSLVGSTEIISTSDLPPTATQPVLASATPGSPAPTRQTAKPDIYQPGDSWRTSTPEEQGLDSATLAEMIALIQAQDYRVDSLAIIRNGYLVVDAYFYPFTPGKTHIIHSCTKSIVSALIGISITQGYIAAVDQPVLTFFPDMPVLDPDSEKATITLEHLLMMASGLDCRDSYLYDWRGLNQMRASDDWVQFVLDLPLVAEPGTRFEYCNGGSYTLSAILQQTTGMTTLEFAMHNLFNPLGITEVEWPASPEGVNYGWGELRMQPLDMAKIGYLYLNEGQWGDQQIVPASWVQTSTSPHIKADTLSDEYGYQWWVDSRGYFLAIGYDGQFIFVLPEQDMVVVFTSSGDFPIPETLLNDYILPVVKSERSLPPNAEAFKQLGSLIQASAGPP